MINLQDQNTLSMEVITTFSLEMKKTLLTTRLTGWTVGTSAGSTAWTWSPWRLLARTRWSRSSSETTTCLTSGAVADCVTSRGVTGRTSSPPLSMGGSGQAPGSRWLPPTPPRPAGATSPGPTPATRLSSSPTTCPSPTTPSSTLTGPWRPAWEFWTTSTMTASNGTISPATTPSHSSARTLSNFSNMSRPLNRNLNLEEISLNLFSLSWPQYFVTVAYLMPSIYLNIYKASPTYMQTYR